MGNVGFWNEGNWHDEPVGPPDGKNYAPVSMPKKDDKVIEMGPGKGYTPVHSAAHGGNNNSGVYGKGGYYYPQSNAYSKKCGGHDGLTVVHTYPNGANLSGASRYDLMRHGVDLIIDCGVDVANMSFVKSCPPEFDDLKAYGVVPYLLRLDWPDRTAPAVGWQFWRALREKFRDGWNIVACCLGGHGRTGTCLAALLIEDGLDSEEAIEKVRTLHCDSAVESASQELYLKWLAAEMPPREEVKE